MTPEQLKRSILQYAIQGKLVEQRPEEGTGEELYNQIQKEKNKLIQEGKIKKQRELSEISDEEIPFNIPNTWKWVRFGNLGDYKKGPFGSALTKSMFVPKNETTIKVYEQKNAIQKNSDIGTYYITREYFEKSMTGFEVCSGDVIVSCAGTIGETYIMPDNIEQGIINQALMRMKIFDPINIDYFLLYFDTILKDSAKSHGKGSAIKNIPPFKILKNYLVAMPPLGEQKRIVKRTKQILQMIDRYAFSWMKLEQLNVGFPDKMKKSILQYSIQGKLVKQKPEEGTAEELYKKIQKEKSKLIQKGKIKKQKALAKITEDEIPFAIPNTWKWVRLNDLVSKNIKRGKAPTYIENSLVQVFAQKCNTKNGKINMDLAKFLDESKLSKYSEEEFIIDQDIVINSTGTGTLGRVGIFYDIDRKDDMCIVPDSHVTVIRVNKYIYFKYIYYFLKANQKYLESMGSGSTKQKELKPIVIMNLLVPLPPYKEQQRIVNKIEEILPYCNHLIK